MPQKKQITSEQILNKAFDIVRSEGDMGLSARKLASELNCSTQPIYNEFSDMNDLKKAISRKARNIMMSYISDSEDNLPDVLKNILGYIEFASKEKMLFKFLFSNNVNDSDNMAKNIIPFSNKLELNMIIYANGIIMMKSFNALNISWEDIRIMIINAYKCFSASNIKEEEV